MIKKTVGILFVAFSMIFVAGCRGAIADDTAQAANTDLAKASEVLTLGIKQINSHGNVILNTTFDEMKAADMEVGDLITVFVGDAAYELPVGTSYTDVDSGEMICRFDLEDSEVALAINYGSFASATGIAEKQTVEEEPGYQWNVRFDKIGLLLKEKQGYLDQYNARNLSRTDAREDYPNLTDEEFANFRAVSVEGIKENTLYRSSTPIEPAIGRNEYAMAAMEKAGIRSVINLDDSVETMQSYSTYPGSFYSKCKIVNPEMSYDFESEEFGAKIKESVLFIIENDGPYLVHCKEGKDRTGILCAILESFVGASAKEVMQDYMITYSNYYHISQADDTYSIILNNTLVKTLDGLFQMQDIEQVNLKEKAKAYLLSTGLTEEQIDILDKKLSEKERLL